MNKLSSLVGLQNSRTKNIVKHIGWSTLYKGGSIIINFLLVPLTIDYLDQENYGVWLTLSSFIGWFSFFDIGLGNGLRNKFAESKAKGEYAIAKAYVSSAYFTIGIIAIVLSALFLMLNNFIEWHTVFNTKETLSNDLNVLMPLVMGFFGLQLIAKLITTIYTADQQHSVQGKIDFLIKLVSIIVVWTLTKTVNSSLLLFGVVFSSLPVLVLLILNIIGFKGRYRSFKPSLKFYNKKYVKNIMGVGIHFFIIQIAAVILFTTDNFIITRLFGPEDVVPYTIAYKYYSIVLMAYSIIIAPFWSSYTEAYAKNEFEWIKSSVKNIQRLWLCIPVVLGGMVLISNWFFKIWVGESIAISYGLSFSMVLYVLLMSYQLIYVQFLNGIGKIKLQLVISLISIVINIPLSIVLSKNLNLGLSGVILATSFSLLFSVVLWPIQYQKIINNKAQGIWNQ